MRCVFGACCVGPGVFSRTRHLSHPCHVARHPLLVSYIAAAVSGARAFAALSPALRLTLAVVDAAQQRCCERFVFECRSTGSSSTATTSATGGSGHSGRPQLSHSAVAAGCESLQSELSACLATLAGCNSLLAPLPAAARCSFALTLCTQQQPPLIQPSGGGDIAGPCWLPVDVSAPAVFTFSSAGLPPLIVPLRSVRTALLDVEVFVEEAADRPGSEPVDSGNATGMYR